MDWIVIENVQPWDGRYPFDINTDGQELTVREWGWIKRLAGYNPLNVADGLSDPELLTVFALIALKRAGKIEQTEVPAMFERFADVPFGGRLAFETDTVEEEDAGPPASSTSGSTPSSGAGSMTSSETSAATPSRSGTPASATSRFDSPTLVT